MSASVWLWNTFSVLFVACLVVAATCCATLFEIDGTDAASSLAAVLCGFALIGAASTECRIVLEINALVAAFGTTTCANAFAFLA